ncbi:hypothetical protein [Marinobacter sp. SS5-14b]|uniref:hypothetical protein n=1 Tax=Marinobacter sp. SS5-14b TaxID=3050456 RepID=UPI0026E07EF9|nr:hypothetical protein [Marinobacter sp. SS5-14b]
MSLNEAIGGYMELELPERDDAWLKKALKFNSARSAFVSLLLQLDIRSVWMPRYICDSMINAVKANAIKIHFYSIDQNFEIAEKVEPSSSSPLLYVNYFGLCEAQAEKVVNRYGSDSVIIDNAQAFFSEPFDCLGTIYSPRKFFGLPDGGLLYTNQQGVKESKNKDDSSHTRLTHLISRLTNSPEDAYQEYIAAEQSIAEMPVMAMSELTERLLRSVDIDSAKQARNRNAAYLHENLESKNNFNIDISKDTAPLCYPFLPKLPTIRREDLIKMRVFLPCYWTEVLFQVSDESFEACMVNDGLFVPCDQRYSLSHVNCLVNLLK